MPAGAIARPGKLLGTPLAVPIGKSRVMQQLRAELQQIAANPSPVLLIGEPGSGREAFARYLHERGPRAAAPFVALDREQPARCGRRGAAVRQRGARTVASCRARSRRRPAARSSSTSSRTCPRARSALLVGVIESGRFTRLGGASAGDAARAHPVLGAAGHRAAHRQRGVAARPVRAPERAHRAGAAAARLRRGRARAAAPPGRSPGR